MSTFHLNKIMLCNLKNNSFFPLNVLNFAWTLHVSLLAAVVSRWASLSKLSLPANSSREDTSSNDRDCIPTLVPGRDIGEDSSDSDEASPQDNFPQVSVSLTAADKWHGVSVYFSFPSELHCLACSSVSLYRGLKKANIRY